MSKDPLNLSQREAIHEVQMKHLRETMKRNEQVAKKIEALEAREFRAWFVAFVALCLAALCLMLFVRARYGTKTSDFTIDNGTGSNPPTLYCAKKDGEWLCEYDPKKLEEEVEPEPTVFGTQPERVEL